MTHSRRLSFLSVSVALSITSPLVACRLQPTAPERSTQPVVTPASRPAEILIGEVGPLTGSEATFGLASRDGVDLAVKQINQKGGIKGRSLKLVVDDDQGKPDEAVTATTRLILQDKVVAVLGEIASGRTMAIAPVAQQHQVPLVSPASTNEKITEVGNYIFRVCYADAFQGTVMAMFAADNMKAATAAILKDNKSDYSVGLSAEFASAFTKLGGTVVAEEAFAAGDIDFKAQLTAIKARHPDVLFIPAYYTEVGLIIRQAKSLGLKSQIIGGDGWDSPKLVEIGGSAVENTYFSSHYSEEAGGDTVKQFVEAFTAAYGHKPDAYAALGYDAAMVLANALTVADGAGGEALQKALAATKDSAGVTGPISFDQNRQPSKVAMVLKVQDGKFRFASRITP